VDRGLIERARNGDREAFTALAEGSVARLYAIAVLIVRDTNRAEDAVQEALIAAWRDLRALRDPGSWEAWSYRLTVRACYRAIRRDKPRILELRVIPTREAGDASDYTQEIVDREQLERGIRLIGVDQRAVLVLHFYLGLPLTEVADVLGIRVGTAKSRLHRGLAAMRQHLTSAVTDDPPKTERTA